MNAVSLPGHVDTEHRLSVQVPDSFPIGPVTVLIVPGSAPAEELDDDWMAGITAEWAEDLSDPRQDIYTLDDGDPVNAP